MCSGHGWLPSRRSARHIPAERSILREGIPAPLAQIPCLRPPRAAGRLFSPWDPHRAREKLFQPGGSSGRLPGTRGCFPSTHVRSKQRKKEKKQKTVLKSFRTAVPLLPLYPSTVRNTGLNPHTAKSQGKRAINTPNTPDSLCRSAAPGRRARCPERGEFVRAGRRGKRAAAYRGKRAGRAQPGAARPGGSLSPCWQGDRGGLCGATERSEQPRSASRTRTHRKFHRGSLSAAEKGEHPPEVRGCREHPRVGMASDPIPLGASGGFLPLQPRSDPPGSPCVRFLGC